MDDETLMSTLSSIHAGKTVILSRKELDALALETGMKRPAPWGGWHITYRKISPGVFEVQLGERFSSVQS
jgi:hypothetical protein